MLGENGWTNELIIMKMTLCCGDTLTSGALFSVAFLVPVAASSSASFAPLTLKNSVSASFCTFAKRRPISAPPAPQNDEVVLDEDLKNSINQLSTDAVKAMLSDDMKRMENLRENLFELEMFFEKENEKDSLMFVLAIRDMLDHRILPEAKQLKGFYKMAFQKIFGILEDSGWQLKGNEDESGIQMIDDDIIPSSVMSEYR